MPATPSSSAAMVHSQHLGWACRLHNDCYDKAHTCFGILRVQCSYPLIVNQLGVPLLNSQVLSRFNRIQCRQNSSRRQLILKCQPICSNLVWLTTEQRSIYLSPSTKISPQPKVWLTRQFAVFRKLDQRSSRIGKNLLTF